MLTVDVNIFINEYKTNSATLKNKQIISKTNKRLINLAYVRTGVKTLRIQIRKYQNYANYRGAV